MSESYNQGRINHHLKALSLKKATAQGLRSISRSIFQCNKYN